MKSEESFKKTTIQWKSHKQNWKTFLFNHVKNFNTSVKINKWWFKNINLFISFSTHVFTTKKNEWNQIVYKFCPEKRYFCHNRYLASFKVKEEVLNLTNNPKTKVLITHSDYLKIYLDNEEKYSLYFLLKKRKKEWKQIVDMIITSAFKPRDNKKDKILNKISFWNLLLNTFKQKK